MNAAEEKFIASGEVRLWAERIGSPDDPAVLLIMGTSAQGIGWPDELVDVLVAGGRQVIRFDHRDTGRSTWRFPTRRWISMRKCGSGRRPASETAT